MYYNISSPPHHHHFAPQLIQLKMSIFTHLLFSFYFSDLNLEELWVKRCHGVTQPTMISPGRLVTFPYARMMLRKKATSQFLLPINRSLLVSATYMVHEKLHEYLHVAVGGYYLYDHRVDLMVHRFYTGHKIAMYR